MDFTEYYSPDYVTARERFLTAARDLHAAVKSYVFQAKGPNNETLTMDVAMQYPLHREYWFRKRVLKVHSFLLFEFDSLQSFYGQQ